ncbi:hypothetical protein [Streptomyces sp. LBL]|uniref:hypothetical protein n=1 Tax=Streptomyces sp. LBL TaxID=2940562 RepID=UPI002475CE0E|nr:hypothetical protein [Streptomyces sp. LBL]
MKTPSPRWAVKAAGIVAAGIAARTAGRITRMGVRALGDPVPLSALPAAPPSAVPKPAG